MAQTMVAACKASRLPTPPTRLMTELPSLRSAGGVRSGISATQGARQNDIMKTKRMMQIIIAGTLPLSPRATLGIIVKTIAAKGAPMRINGLRLPILV